MFNSSRIIHILIICIIGIALFFPFLGSVHLFDWDEINFAECAREMIVTNDYSNVRVNFQAFWEKPPLFIWMQVLSMKFFGVTEFAARFPNALCGIFTLIIIYIVGTKTYGVKFGLLWVLIYVGSFLPHLYFKTGIIDPWFNLFIFLGIYNAILHTNNPLGSNGIKTAVYAALFIGLATLTKGPVAFLIFGLCAGVYAVKNKFRGITSIKNVIVFILVFILTAGSWFFYEIATGNLQVVFDFFEYQVRLFKTKDSGHGGFLGYHFVVLLFGCFPAAIFMVRAWKKSAFDTPFQKHFKLWMNVLFFVVLILFSIVSTKIVHYSSLCYFPLTWLATYSVIKIFSKEFFWTRWMTYFLFFCGVCIGIVFVFIGLIDYFKIWLIESNLIADQFAVDCLRQNVNWYGWEWLIGVFFLLNTLLFLWFVTKSKLKFIIGFFITNCITAFLLLIFITPKVESYSQKAVVDFLKERKGEDCYIENVDFKSFIYLFYTEKEQRQNTLLLMDYVNRSRANAKLSNKEIFDFNYYELNFMMGEKVDKTCYFIVKTTKELSFEADHPTYKKLYKKGGFCFFKRDT